MPRGRILELKNNYGIIDTDAYKVEHEWIPFRIEKSMLEEKEGKQYIKYTDEVEFSLSQSQGVRDRDIKEATDIRFIAAHGRSILTTFMDPDYNGNWDLEFDNVEGRCSVEKWILYDLLKKKWERMGLGDYSKQIVNTLYGNPPRRAWIELNYIYFYIIREIEKMSFKLFVTEAEWFLSKEEDIRQQMSGVNLCSLRLSDMGNTTLGVTAPPYDEIAQEAFSVWELFEGKYR